MVIQRHPKISPGLVRPRPSATTITSCTLHYTLLRGCALFARGRAGIGKKQGHESSAPHTANSRVTNIPRLTRRLRSSRADGSAISTVECSRPFPEQYTQCHFHPPPNPRAKKLKERHTGRHPKVLQRRKPRKPKRRRIRPSDSKPGLSINGADAYYRNTTCSLRLHHPKRPPRRRRRGVQSLP